MNDSKKRPVVIFVGTHLHVLSHEAFSAICDNVCQAMQEPVRVYTLVDVTRPTHRFIHSEGTN